MSSNFPLPPQPPGSSLGTLGKGGRHFQTVFWIIVYLASVWLIGNVIWWIWSYSRWQHVENREPLEVFRHVFQAQPPTGIFEMTAAGEQPHDGNFWLVIRTTNLPALMTIVTKDTKRVDQSAMELYEPGTDLLKREAASVDWESAHHVKNPEYYETIETQGIGYILVVDRARRCIYVGVRIS